MSLILQNMMSLLRRLLRRCPECGHNQHVSTEDESPQCERCGACLRDEPDSDPDADSDDSRD